MKCPNCGDGGFDKGWEWLCPCNGKVIIGVDSFSTPRFNPGLGCYVSSIRDGEKIAKRRGLTPIGDAKMEQVFKPRDEQSSRAIAHEIVRDFHKEHRRCVT